MVNTAHMTKLEAVNQLLWSIGERPVQSLSSGLASAAAAEEILDIVDREVQAIGWHANTERGIELSTNASNQFLVGPDVLRLDTVNAEMHRKTSTPRRSSHIRVGLRRLPDDTGFALYDIANDTFVWTDISTITVDITRFLDFDNLPPNLQTYIWTKAARRYQQGAMSSRVLHEFTVENETEAMINAVQEDENMSDTNMFLTNRHLWNATRRRNPLWG